MRMKKEVAALEADVPRVHFPEAPRTSFDRYCVRLRAILEENDLGKGWAFDENEQHFHTTWSISDQVYDPETGAKCQISVSVEVTLDPRAPLAGEIQRLLEQKERFHVRGRATREAGIRGMVAEMALPTLNPAAVKRGA